MKRSLFLVIFLMNFWSCYAQNYSLFQPNAVPYFTSQDHHLKGIRVDSVKTINNETHYFLYRTPRGNYSSMFPTLDTNGGSWLGKEVIELQNGVTIIPNLWKDTVVIHTQAALNDSWRFYDDTSQNYYDATVTSFDTATVSGVLDSLKIITISAFNSSGINSSDSIHGKQIILSKHHGIFQSFALYSFPFPRGKMDYYMDRTECLVSNGRFIQLFKQIEAVNPSRFDVYDYQPNDVFQYEGSTYTIHHILKEDSVIARNTIAGNQIQYISRVKERTFYYNNVTNKSYIDTSYIYYAIENWFDINLMPDEWGSPVFITYNPNDTSRCKLSPFYSTRNNNIGYVGTVNNFEPQDFIVSYKMGFGNVSDMYYSISYPNSNRSMSMKYSRKNGNPCGNYTPLSTKDLNETTSSIAIYPNPAFEYLSIDTKLNNYDLIVSNIAGEVIKELHNRSQTSQVSVADLPNGVYFIKIFSKEVNAFVTKKFVVQR